MKIIIKSSEIESEGILDAIEEIEKKMESNPNFNNRIRRIAQAKNWALGDMIEAIATHIVVYDKDFEEDGEETLPKHRAYARLIAEKAGNSTKWQNIVDLGGKDHFAMDHIRSQEFEDELNKFGYEVKRCMIKSRFKQPLYKIGWQVRKRKKS